MRTTGWIRNSLMLLIFALMPLTIWASPTLSDLQSDYNIEMNEAVNPATADAPEVVSVEWLLTGTRNPAIDSLAADIRTTKFRLLVYDS